MPDNDALLFRAFLENATENVYVFDHEGRYAYVSRRGAEALGLSVDAIVGRRWEELGLPSELMLPVESQCRNVRASRTTTTHRVEFRGRTYDYDMFPLPEHVAVVARDVTEAASADAQLRRAAERYRNLVANSSEAIWRFELDHAIDSSLDPARQIELMFRDGWLAEANDAMARMYGFSRAEEIIGARLPAMLPPEVPANREYLEAFIASGYRLLEAESVEVDRHGGRKYFMNSLVGVVEDGRLTRAWGTQRDVTEQREVTERIRRSEERLATLVAASTQTMWTAAGEGQLTWITPSWTDATGQSPEDAKGLGWLEHIHPDHREEAVEFWRRAVAQRETVEGTLRIRQKDGTYRWFHVRAVPIRNEDGSVREWVGANTDIDLQITHEHQLSAARDRAELIAAANDVFARSLDVDETLRNVARITAGALADWCAVDMLDEGGSLRRLAVEHPEPELARVAYELQAKYPPRREAPQGAYQVLRTGRTAWIDVIPDELLRSSAISEEHYQLARRLRLRSWICAPIPTRNGVAGVLTLVNTDASRPFTSADVSLAEALAARAGVAIDNARLYQEALEANRAKDEFLATLSHELRTPLTSILGWASLLRMSAFDSDTTRAALETIERSARSQAALIDDLLDISRIVTGKLQLTLAPVDLMAVVTSGAEAVRPAASARDIAISIHGPGSVLTTGDANRLHQIVWNLLTNAVKFSPPSSTIEVNVRTIESRAEIEVTDRGIGIEPALVPRVFERFWQADSSSRRSQAGLGLGLAIVRSLVEFHGGTVSARSEGPGRGATFTVTLPLDRTATLPREAERPQETSGVRVLLVEDDPSTRTVLARMLQHFGANVTPCASAAEGYQEACRSSFDLVLTDIAMPEHDGYWLLDRIRAMRPSQRVVAVTAMGVSPERFNDAGFDGFIRKPVDPDALREILSAERK